MQDEIPEGVKIAAVDYPPKPAVDKSRHFLAVFFLSFMWGTFGVDRFYLGKVWTGILKLITFGGFGLWTLIDLVLIMSGTMCDRQGNPMREADRYKKFAAKTVLIFALVIGAVVLISGASLIYSVYAIMTYFMDAGGTQTSLPFDIPGITDSPVFEQFRQVQDLQNVDTTDISL
jgi:TM2 domain-containing membrane protein YozV